MTGIRKRLASTNENSDPSAPPRRALSIRQPWAEMILRGEKTIEVRSRPTKIRGPMYLYASLTRGADDAKCQAVTGSTWEELDRGKLIGIIEITDCRELKATDSKAAGFAIDFDPSGNFAWLVKPIERLAKPLAPKEHAQPSFFFPFG